MGGFSGSKGKGKFNDIINTKKVKLKEEYMPIGWKSSVGRHWGKGVEDRFDKKKLQVCIKLSNNIKQKKLSHVFPSFS